MEAFLPDPQASAGRGFDTQMTRPLCKRGAGISTQIVTFIAAISVLFSTPSDAAGLKALWTFEAGDPVIAAASVSEGSRIAVLTDHRLQIVETGTGKKVGTIEANQFGHEPLPRFGRGPSSLSAIACSGMRCWIVGGTHRIGFLGRVSVAGDSDTEFTESSMFPEILGMDAGPLGTIVTANVSGTLTLWDAGAMHAVRSMHVPDGMEIYAVRYDGEHYLAGNDSGELIIWNGKTKAPARRLVVEPASHEGRHNPIFALVRFGRYVVAGGYGYLDLVNPKVPSDKRHIEIEHAVSACDALPGASVAWCGLSDGTLISVGLDGKIKSSDKVHDDDIRSVKALAERVITASKDGTVKASLIE